MGFISLNKRASRRLTRLAGLYVNRSGGDAEFNSEVHKRLRPGMRLLDVGGGKNPLILTRIKQSLRLNVTGLDISTDELAAAPYRAYDQTISADVSAGPIPGQYDLIYSKTVLEHVRDVRSAILNMTAALAPGGVMIHYQPGRYSSVAVANRLLGNRLARKILFAIFPEKRHGSGFPAYYDLCTPSRIERTCFDAGLEVVQTRCFFCHSYFNFITPLHAAAVLWQAAFQEIAPRSMCVSFYVIARKH